MAPVKHPIIKGLILSLFFISYHSHADTRLWLSDTRTDGNIGGRAGADAFCNGDANNPGIPASTTRAFLSVDAADEIRDMPANYNIPTNETIFQVDGTTQITVNFAALLDAGTTPLTNIIGGATSPYTGSAGDGSLSIFNCAGWTDNTGGTGQAGSSNETNQFYLTGSASACDTGFPIPIYCISYVNPNMPQVTVTPTTLTTVESGIPVTYEIALNQAPSAGETVTINIASNDVTEGTVAPASLMFSNANWNTPQTVTVTPGASDVVNDGDVGYEISNTVTSVGGTTNFAGVLASNVAVTNQNIDGVDTLTIQPSSGAGLFIDEGSFVDVTVSIVGFTPGPIDVFFVPISTVSTEITLSTPIVILNSGNGFSSTFRITAVADAVVDADTAFTVVTGATGGQAPLTGFNPVDIVGIAVNTDVAVEEQACTAIKTSKGTVFPLCF
ncbi:MAG: DUF1554 domain-containing protein [Gammaproteobacteria bacterium]|nr:DUF1554 domain-containing protein [Gammaproteobacteria bacterium]